MQISSAEKRRDSKRKSYAKSDLQRKNALARTRRWVEKNRFAYSLRQSRHNAEVRGFAACTATISELEAAFSGRCAICGTPETECSRKLHMDHDHNTGQFRGWLCSRCNHGVGLMRDSSHLLRLAATYLDAASSQ